MSAKSLEKLLKASNGGELGDIVRRAREMGDLADALAAALPPDAGASIVAASIRDDGELVVLCRSSAWASRLRFEADALLAAAKNVGAGAESCIVRVAREP